MVCERRGGCRTTSLPEKSAFRNTLLAAIVFWAVAPPAFPAVNCFDCNTAVLPAFFCPVPQTLSTDERPCLNIVNCVQPRMDGPTVQAVDNGDDTFGVRLFVDVRTPFNSDPDAFPNSTLNVAWYQGPSADGPGHSCLNPNTDRTWSYLQFGSLSCSQVPAVLDTYSVRAIECNGGSCMHQEREEGAAVMVTRQTFGCIEERTWSCPKDASCHDCLGPAGASPPGGGGPGLALGDSGPGARLRYAAGGTGSVGTVGAAVWSETLGQSWSHDYAIRIVQDPDVSHVWLLSKAATFREFSDADADGLYTIVRPTTEKRTLRWTGAGWTLTELDGTVHSFDSEGKWRATTTPEGLSKTGTYDASGRLERVDFPDLRHEDFAYDVVGKLASITEVGIDGTTSRTWSYLWAGNDLVRIDRPDGRSWELFYEDLRYPGYMTRMKLVADVSGQSGPSDVNQRKPENRRIEAAWEYDDAGNVLHTWRGAATFDDPEAVDRWTFTYDNPTLPTVTTVTDPLGDESVYTFATDRDSVHDRPKPVSISGDCPVCDLGPEIQLAYTDPANPLLPTEIVDGRGITTAMEYDAHGLMTSRTEAANDMPLARTTEWTYDTTYPALPVATLQPSVAGGTARRAVDWGYDADGNPTSRTISGVESGSAFSHLTTTTYTTEGQVDTIDPPGHGSNDVTSFTYDPTRGNLFPLTRTDPKPPSETMTTSFGYDPYNRRTSVTDPNGLETSTSYDALDRVTEVRQVGLASPTDDLVTTHVYDKFGDLFRTILPKGNVIEYGYDQAGRLVSVERKPDALPDSHGERTVYTLDAAGNRTAEQLQVWDGLGASWVTRSTTNTQYQNRCQPRAVTQGSSTTTYSYL